MKDDITAGAISYNRGRQSTIAAGSEAAVFTNSDRGVYIALAAVSVAALIIGRILRPSIKGYGTHEQFGLPPCPFFHFTGFPCPSCGVTTSFAHAARLQFIDAISTQPFGLVAFLLAVLTIPLCFSFIRSRRPWTEVIHSRYSDPVLYSLIALYLICWIYKIIAIKWPAFPG